MASPPESPTDHPADETTGAPAVDGGVHWSADGAGGAPPVTETPVAETPASETPIAGTSASETPVAETSASETSASETPVAETSASETPVTDTPATDTPGDVPEDGQLRRTGDDWDTDLDVPLAWGGTDVDGEDGWDGSDWDGSDRNDGAPEYASAHAERHVRRRKWRRRRRALGTLAFLLVVVGLGLVIARAAGVGKEDATQAAATTTTAPVTTSTLPPAGPYRALDGLNARTGPGPTFPAVGTIAIGEKVLVICAADGPLVNGPQGQSTKWLQIVTPFGGVYVTAAYVAVGADLTDPNKIGPCPK